jgi:hypothetical protein
MKEISQKELTAEALALFKKNPNSKAFVDLIRGESPDVVEGIMGSGNYDITKQLPQGPAGPMSTLSQEASNVERNLSIQEQAQQGTEALHQLFTQNSGKFRLPQFLSREVALTNRALDVLEGKLGEKTMRILTEASQNPARAQYLLELIPASEKNAALRILSNPQNWSQAQRSASTATLAYLKGEKK